MLREKHKGDIPKMKQGLGERLKQNQTEPDQEKIMWEEFNKFFKVSNPNKKSKESNMNTINLDKYPSLKKAIETIESNTDNLNKYPFLKKAIETTARKSLSFKKTGKDIKEAIESKLALMRLDRAVLIANQNIFDLNKLTMATVHGGVD